MKLPKGTTIMAACEAAGLPRSLDTVRGWTCGRRCPPVWVPVVIAQHLVEKGDAGRYAGEITNGMIVRRLAGELAEELTRRWREKQRQGSDE
jgi:hypothetical protein